MRATFNERVLNVSSSTFLLTEIATGHHVHASVSYQGSTRTATLTPARDLSAGWYEALLRGTITDRAGNRLGPRTWRFQVSGS